MDKAKTLSTPLKERIMAVTFVAGAICAMGSADAIFAGLAACLLGVTIYLAINS